MARTLSLGGLHVLGGCYMSISGVLAGGREIIVKQIVRNLDRMVL